VHFQQCKQMNQQNAQLTSLISILLSRSLLHVLSVTCSPAGGATQTALVILRAVAVPRLQFHCNRGAAN
jgi:hypothetical protein